MQQVLRLGVSFLWLLILPVPARAHGPIGARIEAVTRQLSSKPSDAGLWTDRAELYRRDGRPDLAVQDLETAERLAPESPAPALIRARIALDAGDWADARARLDRVLLTHPGLTPAHLLRAIVLEKLRQSDLAIADLDRAIAIHPTPAPEWFLDRARMELSGGPKNRERALAGLDQGIERLGPVPALSALALELELDLGRHEAALARLDRIEPTGAGRAHWLARRGDVLKHAGRTTEAWVAWSEALDLLGDLPPGRRDSPATQALASQLRLALSNAGQP